jgi:hypothetical protein
MLRSRVRKPAPGTMDSKQLRNLVRSANQIPTAKQTENLIRRQPNRIHEFHAARDRYAKNRETSRKPIAS